MHSSLFLLPKNPISIISISFKPFLVLLPYSIMSLKPIKNFQLI